MCKATIKVTNTPKIFIQYTRFLLRRKRSLDDGYKWFHKELLFGDNPYCVNNAGHITQDSEQDIEPKVPTETDLQKDAKGR